MRDGSLLSCSPEGKAGVPLSVEKDASKFQYFQPTWSPTGDLVGVTRIGKGSRDSTSSQILIKWAHDGTNHAEAEASFVPFYFLWCSPDLDATTPPDDLLPPSIPRV